MRTDYRSVGDGHCLWLEYRKIITIWFLKFHYWARVPSDHWDEWMHEGITAFDHEIYVTSWNYNLEQFVAKYPDIRVWLKERSHTIDRKWHQIEDRKQARTIKNSGTKYL